MLRVTYSPQMSWQEEKSRPDSPAPGPCSGPGNPEIDPVPREPAGWKPALRAPVEGDDVGVLHAGPAENIQRAADRQIDPPPAEARDLLEVGQGSGTTGVGGWDRCPLAEILHQRRVDTAAQALHIDGVDQELVAVASESFQRVGTDFQFGKLLPLRSEERRVGKECR